MFSVKSTIFRPVYENSTFQCNKIKIYIAKIYNIFLSNQTQNDICMSGDICLKHKYIKETTIIKKAISEICDLIANIEKIIFYVISAMTFKS